MNGIELNIRFASKPNELEYCGPNCAHSNFSKYLKRKQNSKEIEESLKKFEALPVYLNAIAKKHGLDMFDYKVAEAYWIGNELLDDFDSKDMEDIINSLVNRGMLRSEGERLKKNLTKGFTPHHIFHVFYIEIGKTSGKIEPLFRFKEKCRPSYGKVKEILDDKLIVSRIPILMNNDKYSLGNEEESEVNYVKSWLPQIKQGDCVAVHWDSAILRLDNEQVRNMDKYTKEFLDRLNTI